MGGSQNFNLLTMQFAKLTAPQGGADPDGTALRLDTEQEQVKQAVNVPAEKEAIRRQVTARKPVFEGNDVRCLERFRHGTAGHAAFRPVAL